MNTGENTQGLRKIADFTRLLSIAILLIHFYILGYPAFRDWDLVSSITDRVIVTIARLSIFQSGMQSKLAALLLLVVSLIAVKGKKDDSLKYKTIWAYGLTGLILYFLPGLMVSHDSNNVGYVAYMVLTGIGFILMLTSGTLISRLLKLNLSKDIFNRDNETFPQEERLLDNEFSVNLPAIYRFQQKEHKSWINIINPFRGTLVCGSPGAGKSYFVIRHIITQHIEKGFSMLIYDFKYDDLSKIAYNALLKNSRAYQVKPAFYVIDLENIQHRCNPLEPQAMNDMTDAVEAARTIMLGLNREWIKQQGQFFPESAITFVTALIWFLKKYENGKYCTLPHVIELALLDYDDLFKLLSLEKEIDAYINPFMSAWKREADEQLEGQIASAKIGLARLASPRLYYVLSGDDFSLDINNPEAPKIICLANNPQKSQVFGAVLSLYVNRINKLANRKNQQKCSMIFDEFPTIYFNGIDNLIATARSNKVAVTLAVQDFSQLKKDYGRDQAEVIMNIIGNVICGQVTGDTAKQLSERFGKIQQQKQSTSINSSDTSVSISTQLDYAVPASRIAALSSGEFVGMVADNPDEEIDLKMFHSRIQNDHEAITHDEKEYASIPKVRIVDDAAITMNFQQIKDDICNLITK
ncbi:conjugal transfer protein MobC [Daejeonella sp.]|uniref:conjugal transfer protein MobC n=1 Tax=Daejeonella sp. TaxID=2805397 RepID=UPI0030BC0550